MGNSPIYHKPACAASGSANRRSAVAGSPTGACDPADRPRLLDALKAGKSVFIPNCCYFGGLCPCKCAGKRAQLDLDFPLFVR
jgi:hypothetical protein